MKVGKVPYLFPKSDAKHFEGHNLILSVSHLEHLEDDVPDPGLGEGLGGALPHEAEQVALHVLEHEVQPRVLADYLRANGAGLLFYVSIWGHFFSLLAPPS